MHGKDVEDGTKDIRCDSDCMLCLYAQCVCLTDNVYEALANSDRKCIQPEELHLRPEEGQSTLTKTSARQTCLSHAGIREPNLSRDYASGEALA